MKAREFANTKLVVFDIDDTLVNTDTRVNVVRDGEVVKQLNSHDFTHYKLQPGEEFDFGRFRDAREFYTNARPIAPMIDRLKRDIATGNKVIMLTARADFNDRDVFLDTFRKYGIDMNRVHVYRAGNLQTRAATEEKKKIILQHLLGKQHYDKVIMYDDSVPNLNAFLTLSSDFPWSRFYAWHVDPNGRATEYHRSGLREDSDTENLPSVTRAQQAIPQILARAQRDYDAWDEEDRDTYAGGGICHIIADSVCDVLSDAGIECTSVSCSHEQHVYVAARFAEGVYTIDIPYHIYEQGGGFSWKKLPDVRFEPRDVVFYRVSGDPADWRDYLDEGLRDIVNYIRNIGSEQDAPIVMMTNPQNTGARTASGQRMRIEDFPLKTVAVSELKPWEPMIKMQDLPSRRTVASLIRTLQQGGRIPPLLVTPVRGGYRIIDGHHRYFALQQAGIEQAPVRVVDPRLIRYSNEVMEALKTTLRRYGHLGTQAMAEGRISDLDIDLQDQQWDSVVGRVEHGVRRGEDPDVMSLALYQWATGEMFDMDEELERRGFGSIADLRDHIRDHGGRYVPPEFDLGAAGSIKDIERLPRRRPDDVSEATSEPDFMRGHCHVMALALLTLHPDWQLRAHIGWDEDAESDNDYRVDHVYVVAPDGTAFDCRGRFASEQELVGPDETGGAETQFVDYDISRVRADVARGELRPFSRRDLEQARAFAQRMDENFADGKIKGKSRPGRVRRAGASCKGSVTDLRARAKKYGGERGKMYHWCANMKSGKKNK
jgi:hypothetical protein